MKKDYSCKTYLLVYVDDVIIAGNNRKEIQKVKDYLHSVFSIKDLGATKYFLGVEINRTKSGTFLSQRKYILDILNDLSLIHI